MTTHSPTPCVFQLLLKMDDLESEFNLKVVLVSFKQCLNEKEEVLLEYYLAGWRGLVRCERGFPGHTSYLYPVGPVQVGHTHLRPRRWEWSRPHPG